MNDETSDLLDELIADCIRAEEAGQLVNRDDLLAEHPQLADDLRQFFADRDQMKSLARPLAPGRARQPAGSTVRYFGDYELLEEIARGGMGVVYKARQTSLNRIVAVKMILLGHLANEEDVKRFRSEAEAAANLRHPRIVTVHEVGIHEGQHYFSMDYIDGRNLSQVIRDKPLPARQAAAYVRDVAEAIHAAHAQGTLHRDLKPSNILIDVEGDVHVTDFGLAMKVEGESDLTHTGQILGTPSYMAPEQAQGNRALVGPASDVYALGVILYELLTGRPPFRAESAAVTIRQVIENEPVSPRVLTPDVPGDLETICLRCLEKEPHRRYTTAQELADDVGRFQQGEPILSRPIGRVARLWRWCKRKPAIAALSTALTIVIALGFVGITSQWRRAVTEREKTTKALGRLIEEQRRRTELENSVTDLETRRRGLGRSVTELQQKLTVEQKQSTTLQSSVGNLARKFRRTAQTIIEKKRITHVFSQHVRTMAASSVKKLIAALNSCVWLRIATSHPWWKR